MSQVSAARLDTNVTPNQGATSSSSSIERGGPQLRAAAAEARRALLLLASRRLGVQINSLVVSDNGVVSVDGEGDFRSVKYGDLLGDKPFNLKSTGTAPQKPPNRYKLVGTRVPRVDLPDKMSGKYELVHHLRVPGMLHGRVVLPRGQRAFGAGAEAAERRRELDQAHPDRARRPQGRFRRRGRGERMGRGQGRGRAQGDVAGRAGTAGQCRPVHPHARAEDHRYRDRQPRRPARKALPARRMCAPRPISVPYQGHLPFAPNCALADVSAGRRADPVVDPGRLQRARRCWPRCSAWTSRRCGCSTTRAPAPSGAAATRTPRRPQRSCRRRPARPVRVQYMRWDEHGWDNYGPAHLAEVRAGVDAHGKLVAYEYHGWQHGWTVTSTMQDIALQKPGVERASGSNSITVNPMSTGSMYVVAEPARHQPRGADGRLSARRGAALAARPVVRVRVRADHRRAGACAEDGSVRVPPQATSATSAGSACSTPPPRRPDGSRG